MEDSPESYLGRLSARQTARARSTVDHRVPLSQTVGVLLDLRLATEAHGRSRG